MIEPKRLRLHINYHADPAFVKLLHENIASKWKELSFRMRIKLVFKCKHDHKTNWMCWMLPCRFAIWTCSICFAMLLLKWRRRVKREHISATFQNQNHAHRIEASFHASQKKRAKREFFTFKPTATWWQPFAQRRNTSASRGNVQCGFNFWWFRVPYNNWKVANFARPYHVQEILCSP